MATTFNVDIRIHDDVLDELALHPRIDLAEIGVAVDAGVVTLSGTVDTFGEKWAATDAAKRVAGVRQVENALAVESFDLGVGTDAGIAAAIRRTIERLGSLPVDRIGVDVRNGRVALSGSVDRQWQRTAAYYAALSIVGVRGVRCDIELGPRPALSAGWSGAGSGAVDAIPATAA